MNKNVENKLMKNETLHNLINCQELINFREFVKPIKKNALLIIKLTNEMYFIDAFSN